MSRIAVVGAGSWGTALAMVLARRGGHSITIWSHTRLVADCIQRTRENCFYLPGLRIPEAVQVTTELEDAVGGREILIVAVPSEHFRTVCTAMTPLITDNQLIVNATKGIEDGTYLRMTQVIQDVLTRRQSASAMRRAQWTVLRAGGGRRQSHGDYDCVLRSSGGGAGAGGIRQPDAAALHQ